jgi:F0F1-type ATP synthase membrane subunit c/vacuolar-type H+-ATPase subunit K
MNILHIVLAASLGQGTVAAGLLDNVARSGKQKSKV